MPKDRVVTAFSAVSPMMEASLADGARVVLTVTGGSMRPYLRHRRDQVVLERCDPLTLHVGEVPLYRRADGSPVLHRITGRRADGYILCGDAQSHKEYGVQPEAILAKAVGFYRRGKYVACTALTYRLYWRAWLAVLPLRPLLLRCGGALRRAVRRIPS